MTIDPRLVRLRLQFALAEATGNPSTHAADVAIRATYLAEAFIKANPDALDALEPAAEAHPAPAPSDSAQRYLDRAREMSHPPRGSLGLDEVAFPTRAKRHAEDYPGGGIFPRDADEMKVTNRMVKRGFVRAAECGGVTVLTITDAGLRALGEG